MGEGIVSHLSRKGVSLIVVKQSHEPQIDLGSDAGRYWNAGARAVVVVSPSETVVYKERTASLKEAILRLPYYFPLVIAEGFRGCDVGKAIAIVENEEELKHIANEPGIWFIVSHDFDIVEKAREMGMNALLFEDVEALAGEIYKDAVSTLLSLIPGKDCEICGVGSCLELAEALLTRDIEPIECPLLTKTTVVVNDKPLHLDPVIENLLRNLVRAFLSSIKGVPPTAKKFRVEVSLE